jgi:hypothetical protein
MNKILPIQVAVTTLAPRGDGSLYKREESFEYIDAADLEKLETALKEKSTANEIHQVNILNEQRVVSVEKITEYL